MFHWVSQVSRGLLDVVHLVEDHHLVALVGFPNVVGIVSVRQS